jgi:hypothetical protein
MSATIGSSGRWGIFYAAGGDKPEAFFGFIQNRCHQVNGTRIAFWASRIEVDRIARLARKIGAKNLEGPELCPYYNHGYYAAFSRIRLAINWKSAPGKIRLLGASKTSRFSRGFGQLDFSPSDKVKKEQ